MAATKSEHGGGTVPAVEEMSYTAASDELDEIVRFFEDRDVDVDQLVGRLVRATAIIEELDERLRRTRVQVEQLVPKLTKVLSANARLDDDVPGTTDELDDDVPGRTDELDDSPTGEVGDVAVGETQDEGAPGSPARPSGPDNAALF